MCDREKVFFEKALLLVVSGQALRWSQSAIEAAKVRAEECEQTGTISHAR